MWRCAEERKKNKEKWEEVAVDTEKNKTVNFFPLTLFLCIKYAYMHLCVSSSTVPVFGGMDTLYLRALQ